MPSLRQFLKDESGATAIEYGLMTLVFTLGVIILINRAGISLRDDVFAVLADALQVTGPAE